MAWILRSAPMSSIGDTIFSTSRRFFGSYADVMSGAGSRLSLLAVLAPDLAASAMAPSTDGELAILRASPFRPCPGPQRGAAPLQEGVLNTQCGASLSSGFGSSQKPMLPFAASGLAIGGHVFGSSRALLSMRARPSSRSSASALTQASYSTFGGGNGGPPKGIRQLVEEVAERVDRLEAIVGKEPPGRRALWRCEQEFQAKYGHLKRHQICWELIKLLPVAQTVNIVVVTAAIVAVTSTALHQ